MRYMSHQLLNVGHDVVHTLCFVAHLSPKLTTMESTATLRRIVGQYTRFDALVAGDEGEWAVERLERGWIDTAMLVSEMLISCC